MEKIKNRECLHCGGVAQKNAIICKDCAKKDEKKLFNNLLVSIIGLVSICLFFHFLNQ